MGLDWLQELATMAAVVVAYGAGRVTKYAAGRSAAVRPHRRLRSVDLMPVEGDIRRLGDDIGYAKKRLDDKIGYTERHLDRDIGYAKKRLDDKIGYAERRLDREIGYTKERLDTTIDYAEQRLDTKIGYAKQHLDTKIDSIERRLDARIDWVDARVGRADDRIREVWLELKRDIRASESRLLEAIRRNAA